jgi:hypothetical protein
MTYVLSATYTERSYGIRIYFLLTPISVLCLKVNRIISDEPHTTPSFVVNDLTTRGNHPPKRDPPLGRKAPHNYHTTPLAVPRSCVGRVTGDMQHAASNAWAITSPHRAGCDKDPMRTADMKLLTPFGTLRQHTSIILKKPSSSQSNRPRTHNRPRMPFKLIMRLQPRWAAPCTRAIGQERIRTQQVRVPFHTPRPTSHTYAYPLKP